MATGRATLIVEAGPNRGDIVNLEAGCCRLIGRHLSDGETAMIDREGNRVLEGRAADIISNHLKDKAPAIGSTAAAGFEAGSFERGPDIVLSDDAISRAHAMVFHDQEGTGIIDLASTNGTNLNEQPVSSALIQNGDSISIGKTTIAISMN